MNHQRRRQLAEAADALDTIQQLLPKAKETIQSVLADELVYLANIPEPLKGSRKASDSTRVVRALQSALALMDDVNPVPATHALTKALVTPVESTTFGVCHEGVSLRAAATHALEALQGGVPRRRRLELAEELKAALH